MADAGQSLFVVAFVPIFTSCRLSAGWISCQLPDLTPAVELMGHLKSDPSARPHNCTPINKKMGCTSSVHTVSPGSTSPGKTDGKPE